MRVLRPRAVVGLDAAGVAGVVLSGGFGAPRVRGFAQVPLEGDALAPSPVEANVVRPEAVRDALGRLAASLDLARTAALVLLPVGIARLALLEVPRAVASREFARYKLLGGLPYPPEEAVIDVLEVGEGRAVGAAVRRSVLEGYEAAISAAGLITERIDLAPLAALGALRAPPPGGGLVVDLVLGDAALVISVHEGQAFRALRSRWRDPSPEEVHRLRDEADRTSAAVTANGSPPRIRVVGPGATGLLRAWTAEGRQAEAGWRAEGLPFDAAELTWFGGALA